jgi:hypothetical protein
MGMFDTVRIEGLKLKAPREVTSFLSKNNVELPTDFQTKDLENVMGTYIIKKNNQIYVERYVPTGKKVARNDFFSTWTDNRSFVERLYYKCKFRKIDQKESRLVPEMKKVEKKSDISSIFNFYTYEEVAGRLLDIEYTAEAIRGRIKRIKLTKWEIESESAAKKRKAEREVFDKKMLESFEARNKFKSQWYYPALKEIYNPIVLLTRLAIQGTCNFIVKQTYRWHGI